MAQTINIQISLDRPQGSETFDSKNIPNIVVNVNDPSRPVTNIVTAPAQAFVSAANASYAPRALSHSYGNNNNARGPSQYDSSGDEKRRIEQHISRAYHSDEELVRNADGAGPNGDGEPLWLAEGMSKARQAMFISIVCLSQFFTQAALLNTLIQLHVIGNDFGISAPGDLAWLVAGYSLTVGTFIIFSGRLGDVFGHSRIVIIGMAWFTVWTVVAGMSSQVSYFLFVLCRVFQGIGPALCLPNGMALLGSAFPPGPQKTMAFSFFAASAPCGAILGALTAGLIDEISIWEWTYYSMAIVLLFSTIIALISLPKDHVACTTTWSTAMTDLDIPGATLGIVGMVLFNFAWNQAPSVGWDAPEILITIVVGTIMFIAFIYIEMKVAENPLIPKALLMNRDVGLVLAAVMFGWGTFGIWSMFFIQIIQEIRHISPLMSAVWLIPLMPMGIVAAMITGWFLGPLGVPASVVMMISLMAFLIGTLLTVTMPVEQTYWGQAFISVMIIPFGMDMSFPAATLIMSNSVSRKHQGVAASLINTVVNYGISLGLGYAGTLEANYSRGGRTPEDKLRGFRAALWVGVVLAALGVLVCVAYLGLFIRERDSKQHLTSDSEDEMGQRNEKM
ncbi:multidrug-resistance type transporter aminotriazole resistance [Ceratocystis pirilliformis]|uniref:Multidrug-resistance type transporter aminotriazole resistance n=1 Tax=Ceratocystis pirilliformis TaxID=259994 RepID=A0ABR3ZLU7_9PEZI